MNKKNVAATKQFAAMKIASVRRFYRRIRVEKSIRSVRRALSPPYCPEYFFCVLFFISGCGKNARRD